MLANIRAIGKERVRSTTSIDFFRAFRYLSFLLAPQRCFSDLPIEQSTEVKKHNETGSLWISIITSGLKSAVAFFGTAPAVA